MTDSDRIKKIVDQRIQTGAQGNQAQWMLRLGLAVLVLWVGGSVTWAIAASADIRANRERQMSSDKRHADYVEQIGRKLNRMEDKLDRLIERNK